MRIRSIRVLSGPNYWSIRRHKLIQMRLDLEDLQERPTNTIPGFKERLEALLPGLWEHQCSAAAMGDSCNGWKRAPSWAMWWSMWPWNCRLWPA
jgi:hypothetical protein